MTPGTKRTILTSKTTGRRYFLVRSTSRPAGRRYYVCSIPTCKTRVSREADLYCKVHAQEQQDQTKDLTNLDKDNENENEINSEEILTTTNEMKENENNDSTNSNTNQSTNEMTSSRIIRDSAGRRRYICMHESCTNVLKRQSDVYCRLHASTEKIQDEIKKDIRKRKRHSTSIISSDEKKNRYRSPFDTSINQTIENSTNDEQSDEYETPKKKTSQRSGTTRTFRDSSGKLRFLCSILTCRSRVPRQSELYCKRHQRELQENNLSNFNQENGNHKEEINVEINQTNSIEKSSTNLSVVSADKIVIATTTLPDDQWADVISFIRKFPQIQLSSNLNINNLTTHLLVDDSENNLHCTITKKIVQAAVRHNIFIISSRWVSECMRLDTFIDEHQYEIISDSHTTLRLSEQNINLTNKFLFNQSSQCSYGFAIECRQCQGSINRSELIELIQLTGAQLFQNEQAVDTLIVLCDTNDKNLDKIKEKYKTAPASNIKFVTSDFLLKSIIKFEIQDIEKYCL